MQTEFLVPSIYLAARVAFINIFVSYLFLFVRSYICVLRREFDSTF